MFRRALPLACLLAVAAPGVSADGPLLQPFGAAGAEPAAPWHVVGLPMQRKPFTRFGVVDADGRPALRVEATESYGNLVHPLRLDHPPTALAWRWRVDEAVPGADLHRRDGDDTALKVCVFFDLPIENVPFVERQVLRLLRSQSAEPLPAATVCYVWDPHLPPGTTLDNAFTHRLRYVVLHGADVPLRRWTSERRDVVADFKRLFGAESPTVPPVIGVAVGADTDNTHSHSVGLVADLVLEP